MVRENLSVTHLIDSDFTYLNSRLAQFYGIDGVAGDEFRWISLRPEHRRGGVLTQGAILKVTANGTNTSPVVRGAWVADRLLGEQIPPPPDNVPAIEPDIRGAKSIREMLAKHREAIGAKKRDISDEEIVHRLVFALVNEAAHLLEEGIAQRASDVDMVYLTGYGFPIWRGGPMCYADTVGLFNVVQAMKRFARDPMDDGAFWKPAPLLARLVAEGKSFT